MTGRARLSKISFMRFFGVVAGLAILLDDFVLLDAFAMRRPRARGHAPAAAGDRGGGQRLKPRHAGGGLAPATPALPLPGLPLKFTTIA